jgi:rhomboid protease GluP
LTRKPESFTPLPRGLVTLAAFLALVEIVLSLADRGILFDPTLRIRVLQAGAFWTGLLRGDPPLFAAQPATMFVSHALLHGSFLHMAMNTAVLLALGRFASDRYGAGVALPLFLAGAVCGGAAFALLSAAPYPMVGASGAVFAFLGLWTMWDWRRHRAAGASVRPVVNRVLVLAGINLVLYFGLGGFLAWEAHLGGFLAGLVAGHLLEDREIARARVARAERRRRLWGGGD